MGKGRWKRKKKKGHTPGLGALKTERKTRKNEEKESRRHAEGDEDDIDAILERIKLEEKQLRELTIQDDCPPPMARVNCSFTPTNNPKFGEVILFGGEFYNQVSGKIHVNGDLYKYNVDKNRWTKVTCPTSPPPRSAHQAVIHKDQLYVFGGEFTSPNQEKFHHFRDLWRLDLSTNQWDELPSKGGPSARSGHRMVCYKNKIILFGGFYDTGRDEMKYYNDLWVFDIDDLKWTSVGDPKAKWPSRRSACQMCVYEDYLYMHAGYTKEKDINEDDMEHGKVLEDTWCLDLKTYKWEKIKKAGMAPGPRSGFAMVKHKKRAIVYGGVTDNENQGGEDLSSDFHNDLYQLNLENHRWFPVQLRPTKKQQKDDDDNNGDNQSSSSNQIANPKSANQTEIGKIDPEVQEKLKHLLAQGKTKESPVYKAAVRIQARYRGYVVRKAYKLYKIGGIVSEILYSPAQYGIDMSVKNMPKPRGRINASACVIKNTLVLFGGIVEIVEKEITLDDLWTLDLNKLDGWKCVKENTVGEEDFRIEEGGDGSSSGEEDESGEEGTDDESGGEDSEEDDNKAKDNQKGQSSSKK